MTTFLEMVKVNDGYNGHTAWLALCQDGNNILAISYFGWFTIKNKSQLSIVKE